jgi:transposase, IS5 family
MYRKHHNGQLPIADFHVPFGGTLDPDNRWVLFSSLMPWEELEETYAPQFNPTTGAPAKPVRLAFGALFIKQRLGLTDEETVEQIRENAYMQYFLGFAGYSSKAPFDPSMMVHFRKRFTQEELNRINELIAERGKDLVKEAFASVQDKNNPDDPDDESGSQLSLDDFVKPADWPEDKNWGTLTIDASCAPADITYPTDLKLLNEARQSTERMIDDLCGQATDLRQYRPRYDRGKARANFLNVAKQKKPRRRKIKLRYAVSLTICIAILMPSIRSSEAWEAQACSSVPSTEKCSSLSSGLTSGAPISFSRNFPITASLSSRSLFLV